MPLTVLLRAVFCVLHDAKFSLCAREVRKFRWHSRLCDMSRMSGRSAVGVLSSGDAHLAKIMSKLCQNSVPIYQNYAKTLPKLCQNFTRHSAKPLIPGRRPCPFLWSVSCLFCPFLGSAFLRLSLFPCPFGFVCHC